MRKEFLAEPDERLFRGPVHAFLSIRHLVQQRGHDRRRRRAQSVRIRPEEEGQERREEVEGGRV